MDRNGQNKEQGEVVELRCTFVFTIYSVESWSVVRYTAEDLSDFIACGNSLPQAKGTEYKLYGRWKTNPKYGKQFFVDYYEELLPTTKRGFIFYLKSLKCGIGGGKATKIYDRFGEESWTVIENEPHRIAEIPGISERNVQRIQAALMQTHVLRDVMKLFQGNCDMTATKANALINAFGKRTMFVIKEHTYRICSVKGFSFPSVDKMALSLGKEPNSMERIYAAIPYLFDVQAGMGNICVPYKEYITQLVRLLNNGYRTIVVSQELVCTALKNQIMGGGVKFQSGYLYSENRYIEEVSSVDNLKEIMANKKAVDAKSLEEQLIKFEDENSITLADSQKDAVRMVFQNPVSIITGGPGTGKTTIIKAILFVMKHLMKGAVPCLLAPTAKAARRMVEQSGQDACTVHSAIRFTGAEDIKNYITEKSKEDKEEEKRILEYANVVIVDEVSMLDQFVFAALLSQVRKDAKLVFVGDPDQLPSVGAGEVLYQMIRSREIPMTKLSVVYRQAETNPIIYNAGLINAGNTELKFASGFEIVERMEQKDTLLAAEDLYYTAVNNYGLDNVILLCPVRRKTQSHPILNVKNLNQDIQNALNPHIPGNPEFKRDDIVFRVGDKVIQTKNTEKAKNGDTGRVDKIFSEADPDDPSQWIQKMSVHFDGGDTVIYDAEKVRDLDLAYAMSVHKSQGSEYGSVIFICDQSHALMLKRNLVYTAVTRAKEQVIIVGQRSALNQAIKSETLKHRYSLLGDRCHAKLAA